MIRRQFLVASTAAVIAPRFLTAAPDAKAVQAVIDKGIAFLVSKQQANGMFGSPRAGEPGLTALILTGMLRGGKTVNDPAVAKGLKYLESKIQPDGGIYDRGLSNYTTSLAIMALAQTKDAKYNDAIAAAGKYLRTLQYGDAADVPDSDAKFGGAGYGKKGERGGGADLSNTHFFLEALMASGAARDDPAVKRAVVFLGRSQNLPGEFNTLDYAKHADAADKGGFVYNSADAADTKSPKRTAAGGLRSEGGMTYAGLKSFLYAGVSKDDPRVQAALGWIRKHYTLDENPGQAANGLFYYYHTFAKAMAALGEDQFADDKGVKHDWKKELFDKLKGMQKADGSWTNEKSKAFLESMPELATAFAVLALTYCK